MFSIDLIKRPKVPSRVMVTVTVSHDNAEFIKRLQEEASDQTGPRNRSLVVDSILTAVRQDYERTHANQGAM